MNVTELLDFAAIPYQQKEQDNIYIECPQCGKNSLSINVHSGAYHCWSESCAKRGHVAQLAREFNVKDFTFDPSATPPRVRELSEEDLLAIENSLTSTAEIIEFCAKRSLNTDFVFRNKVVGYDKHTSSVVFPFYADSRIVGAKFKRANGDQWIRGREPDLYVIESSSLKSDRIVLVEGEIDAITLSQLGIPVAATLGAGKVKGFEAVRRVKQIYLGYDMDGAGASGVEKAVAELGHYRCKRVDWTAKDPNDMLKAGATKEDFVKCLMSAKSLLRDTRSIKGADALDDFVEQSQKVSKNRLSWGYPRLDSFTKGIGGGMFIALLAEAGTGKTTFILNAARNMMEAGVKVGICSLEEQNVMEVTPKLAAMHIGRNPEAGPFSSAEIAKGKKFMENMVLYEGDETRDDVIEWIKECYYAHDVRVIFLDYLQLLFGDEKNTEQVKKDCYAFKRLVRKECKDLCIVAIVQPKQKQKLLTREGVVSSEELDGSDARSGGAINQSVDAFLTMRAVKGYSNLTKLQFTKVRGHLRVSKKAWLGKATVLEFNEDTQRQIEVEDNYGY